MQYVVLNIRAGWRDEGSHPPLRRNQMQARRLGERLPGQVTNITLDLSHTVCNKELSMASVVSPPAVMEVRDPRGRAYRVGERPYDLIGHSRTWILWLSWVAMAGIGVLQYGYGV